MEVSVVKTKKGWMALVELKQGKFGREFFYKKDAISCKEELERAGEEKVVVVYGLNHYLHPV